MFVILTEAPSSLASQRAVMQLRREFKAARLDTVVGGATAGEVDLANRISSKMPAAVAIAIVIALVLLILGLRSIVIPIKAMICSGLSVVATLGLLCILWPSASGGGGIAFFVPAVAFVLTLGLSIDYEVFLVNRIQEAATEGETTEGAVAQGLTRTARSISLAGLAVAVVFSAFVVSELMAVRQLGTAVVIGVVIDVSIVRWMLSPACVVIAGRWNWWLPTVRGKRR